MEIHCREELWREGCSESFNVGKGTFRNVSKVWDFGMNVHVHE